MTETFDSRAFVRSWIGPSALPEPHKPVCKNLSDVEVRCSILYPVNPARVHATLQTIQFVLVTPISTRCAIIGVFPVSTAAVADITHSGQ